MNEVVEGSPPAVDNTVAFPSLDAPATPARLAAISATPKLILAQTRDDLLHDRVLFMNNVGQGLQVNETSFRLYFGKYTVIDVKRPLDLQRNVPHPTAFVMLGSVEQRDQAVKQLKDVPMQGRQVTLEVPKTFQNGMCTRIQTTLAPLLVQGCHDHTRHRIAFICVDSA